jgi:hypothetical protein
MQFINVDYVLSWCYPIEEGSPISFEGSQASTVCPGENSVKVKVSNERGWNETGHRSTWRVNLFRCNSARRKLHRDLPWTGAGSPEHNRWRLTA